MSSCLASTLQYPRGLGRLWRRLVTAASSGRSGSRDVLGDALVKSCEADGIKVTVASIDKLIGEGANMLADEPYGKLLKEMGETQGFPAEASPEPVTTNRALARLPRGRWPQYTAWAAMRAVNRRRTLKCCGVSRCNPLCAWNVEHQDLPRGPT